MKRPHSLIVADPSVMSGVPCIKGTRVTVANILRQLAAGRTSEEIRKDYPYLPPESIPAVLAFAADLASGETHDLLAS